MPDTIPTPAEKTLSAPATARRPPPAVAGHAAQTLALAPDAWDARLLADPHAVADKRRRVQQMFAAIAPTYDLNNRLHSLGVDQLWRRTAVRLAELKPADHVVDVACGTGDLTQQFAAALWSGPESPSRAGDARVIGIDFTFEMLPLAQRKAARTFAPIRSHPRPTFLSETIRYVNGDAQALPLPDACADVVSIAFGIRNVQDPAAALAEFRRVLRPGGRLVVLEFSLPTNPVLRRLYNAYFRHVLPRTATLVSGDRTGAYKYLPQSVNTFIGRDQMLALMAAAGFADARPFPMTFGVAVCYRGLVPPAAA